MRDGVSVLSGPPPFLMNWLQKGQTYDLDVWVSEYPTAVFFGHMGGKKNKPPVSREVPVWSLRNLTYSLNDEWSNSQNTTIDLDLETI